MGYAELGYGEGKYGVTEPKESLFGNIHLFEIFPDTEPEEPEVEDVELTVDLEIPIVQKIRHQVSYKLPLTHKIRNKEQFKIPFIISKTKKHLIKSPIIQKTTNIISLLIGIVHNFSQFVGITGRKPEKRILQFNKTLNIEWDQKQIEKILEVL